LRSKGFLRIPLLIATIMPLQGCFFFYIPGDVIHAIANPSTSNPHAQSIAIAEKTGNYQTMLREAQVWVSEQPNNAAPYYAEGTAYLRLSQWGQSIQSFKTAIAIQPTFAKAWNNLGVSQASSGDLANASISFHKALEIQPDYANPWVGLGRIANYEGRHDEVVEAYHMLKKLDPSKAEAFRRQYAIQES
jgi:Flp pilus assembly protein TadD